MKEYIVTDYGVKANCESYQTKELQAVLDMCRKSGGKVIIPAGEYKISSVRMWSDTELYLESGAVILGSDNCDDYEVFELDDDYVLYSDQQAFIYRHNGIVRDEYRHAMISAYGEKNISIIGEEGSVIDGRDCYDPEGEENFRGPHGIFLSNCENVLLKGYIIQNSGAFMHEAHNCDNLVMDGVTSLAGHDGIHLHKTRNSVIKNCIFRTGDDCIAGCNVQNLTVKDCEINTSCNDFRIGGNNIFIENCNVWGPGYYPHRLTVVKGRDTKFERTDGRHNTLNFIEFFATRQFPNDVPSNITVKNCTVKGVDKIMNYNDGLELWYHEGQRFGEITFENVDFEDLEAPSFVRGNADEPIRINLKNVKASFRNGEDKPLFDAQNAIINKE